jgi:hypothetical protein
VEPLLDRLEPLLKASDNEAAGLVVQTASQLEDGELKNRLQKMSLVKGK